MIKRLFLVTIILLLSANAFAQNFDGLWRSQGYGYIVAIQNNESLIHQVTTVSLIPWVAGTVAGDSLLVGDIPLGTLSKSGDNLILTLTLAEVIKFDSIDTLPAITEPTADPEINFEVFWHSFEENCALFTLTGVDWKAMYNQYRPRVTAATTEAELFDIFKEMLTPLKDGHTRI
ncbi:MAG: S41 family peptidase, partial [bacterium]